MAVLSRRQLLKSAAASAAVPAMWHLGSGLLLADEVQEKKAKQKVAKKAKQDPYADAKFVDGPPALPKEDSITIVALPDTQHYSLEHPQNFRAQTEWIAAHAKERRITSVLHLGDITHRSTRPEWEVARDAMSRLDGVVPYFMVPGNHDYSDGKKLCVDRQTLFSEYFPVAKFQDLSTFGGTYDKEPERYENSYHTYSAGGQDYLVLCLEYGPRHDVVRWANDVVKEHAKHRAILITHAYMYHDDTRYDWDKYGKNQNWSPRGSGIAKSTNGDVLDGQGLWDKLVSQHENFILTLNGHVLYDGLGRLTSQNMANKNVHQMLVNFQMKPKGGDGWLRLLEVANDGKTIEVIDYSPTRNQCNVSPQNRFTLQYS
jgi:predicted phosphodiesterase